MKKKDYIAKDFRHTQLVVEADALCKEVFYSSKEAAGLSFETNIEEVRKTHFGGACLCLSGLLAAVLSRYCFRTKLFQAQAMLFCHVWLETDDGIVIDATINQFPGWRKCPLYIGPRVKGIHPLPKPKDPEADFLGLEQFSEIDYVSLAKVWGKGHALEIETLFDLRNKILPLLDKKLVES